MPDTDFERGYKQGYDHGYLKAMADMQKEADTPKEESVGTLDVSDLPEDHVIADAELAGQVGVVEGTVLRELYDLNGDVVGYAVVVA